MKRLFACILSVLLMVMTGCATMMGASPQMVNSLDYVRQHKGEGPRHALLGSETELMDMAVKSMEDAGYAVVREPHSVFAKYIETTTEVTLDMSYAFYFYPSQTNNQTEVEVLIASPWLSAEQIRGFQKQALSSTFYLAVINMKLQEKGYDPNVKEKGAMLALSYAASEGQRNLAKKLINKGADLDLAVYELKETASKQLPYLSSPANRKTYDRANLGIEMINGLRPKQVEPATNVATNTALSPVLEKTIIQSDVDDLPSIKAKPNKNAYAIVIGIENYRQKLPKADYAIHDAQTVTEYLTKVMGYPEENIVTLTNEHATKSDFEKYFEKWLPNNVENGSTVLVYYSGHGAPNTKTGDAYLVPYDGDPSFIEQTGYLLKKLYESLNKLPAKEIIVALDSCFSGAGGRSVIAKGARPLVMNLQNNAALSKNMTVLSASSGEQISSTYDEKGHGLFTYFMLKGIKNEDVVQPDGSIAISDLFNYLKPQVERIARKQFNNEQTPQLIGAKKN